MEPGKTDSDYFRDTDMQMGNLKEVDMTGNQPPADSQYYEEHCGHTLDILLELYFAVLNLDSLGILAGFDVLQLQTKLTLNSNFPNLAYQNNAGRPKLTSKNILPIGSFPLIPTT